MISLEVLFGFLWRVGHPRLKTAGGLDSSKLSLPCHECRNPARPRLQSCCLLPHGQRCMPKSLKQLSQRWCCAVCQPIFSGGPAILFGRGVILAATRRDSGRVVDHDRDGVFRSDVSTQCGYWPTIGGEGQSGRESSRRAECRDGV